MEMTRTEVQCLERTILEEHEPDNHDSDPLGKLWQADTPSEEDTFEEEVERYIEAAMADATDDVDCSLSTVHDRGTKMGDFIETYGEPVAEALHIAVEMMACENGYYASGARYIGKYTQRTPVELLCDGGRQKTVPLIQRHAVHTSLVPQEDR